MRTGVAAWVCLATVSAYLAPASSAHVSNVPKVETKESNGRTVEDSRFAYEDSIGYLAFAKRDASNESLSKPQSVQAKGFSATSNKPVAVQSSPPSSSVNENPGSLQRTSASGTVKSLASDGSPKSSSPALISSGNTRSPPRVTSTGSKPHQLSHEASKTTDILAKSIQPGDSKSAKSHTWKTSSGESPSTNLVHTKSQDLSRSKTPRRSHADSHGINSGHSETRAVKSSLSPGIHSAVSQRVDASTIVEVRSSQNSPIISHGKQTTPSQAVTKSSSQFISSSSTVPTSSLSSSQGDETKSDDPMLTAKSKPGFSSVMSRRSETEWNGVYRSHTASLSSKGSMENSQGLTSSEGSTYTGEVDAVSLQAKSSNAITYPTASKGNSSESFKSKTNAKTRAQESGSARNSYASSNMDASLTSQNLRLSTSTQAPTKANATKSSKRETSTQQESRHVNIQSSQALKPHNSSAQVSSSSNTHPDLSSFSRSSNKNQVAASSASTPAHTSTRRAANGDGSQFSPSGSQRIENETLAITGSAQSASRSKVLLTSVTESHSATAESRNTSVRSVKSNENSFSSHALSSEMHRTSIQSQIILSRNNSLMTGSPYVSSAGVKGSVSQAWSSAPDTLARTAHSSLNNSSARYPIASVETQMSSSLKKVKTSRPEKNATTLNRAVLSTNILGSLAGSSQLVSATQTDTRNDTTSSEVSRSGLSRAHNFSSHSHWSTHAANANASHTAGLFTRKPSGNDHVNHSLGHSLRPIPTFNVTTTQANRRQSSSVAESIDAAFRTSYGASNRSRSGYASGASRTFIATNNGSTYNSPSAKAGLSQSFNATRTLPAAVTGRYNESATKAFTHFGNSTGNTFSSRFSQSLNSNSRASRDAVVSHSSGNRSHSFVKMQTFSKLTKSINSNITGTSNSTNRAENKVSSTLITPSLNYSSRAPTPTDYHNVSGVSSLSASGQSFKVSQSLPRTNAISTRSANRTGGANSTQSKQSHFPLSSLPSTGMGRVSSIRQSSSGAKTQNSTRAYATSVGFANRTGESYSGQFRPTYLQTSKLPSGAKGPVSSENQSNNSVGRQTFSKVSQNLSASGTRYISSVIYRPTHLNGTISPSSTGSSHATIEAYTNSTTSPKSHHATSERFNQSTIDTESKSAIVATPSHSKNFTQTRDSSASHLAASNVSHVSKAYNKSSSWVGGKTSSTVNMTSRVSTSLVQSPNRASPFNASTTALAKSMSSPSLSFTIKARSASQSSYSLRNHSTIAPVTSSMIVLSPTKSAYLSNSTRGLNSWGLQNVTSRWAGHSTPSARSSSSHNVTILMSETRATSSMQKPYSVGSTSNMTSSRTPNTTQAFWPSPKLSQTSHSQSAQFSMNTSNSSLHSTHPNALTSNAQIASNLTHSSTYTFPTQIQTGYSTAKVSESVRSNRTENPESSASLFSHRGNINGSVMTTREVASSSESSTGLPNASAAFSRKANRPSSSPKGDLLPTQSSPDQGDRSKSAQTTSNTTMVLAGGSSRERTAAASSPPTTASESDQTSVLSRSSASEIVRSSHAGNQPTASSSNTTVLPATYLPSAENSAPHHSHSTTQTPARTTAGKESGLQHSSRQSTSLLASSSESTPALVTDSTSVKTSTTDTPNWSKPTWNRGSAVTTTVYSTVSEAFTSARTRVANGTVTSVIVVVPTEYPKSQSTFSQRSSEERQSTFVTTPIATETAPVKSSSLSASSAKQSQTTPAYQSQASGENTPTPSVPSAVSGDVSTLESSSAATPRTNSETAKSIVQRETTSETATGDKGAWAGSTSTPSGSRHPSGEVSSTKTPVTNDLGSTASHTVSSTSRTKQSTPEISSVDETSTSSESSSPQQPSATALSSKSVEQSSTGRSEGSTAPGSEHTQLSASSRPSVHSTLQEARISGKGQTSQEAWSAGQILQDHYQTSQTAAVTVGTSESGATSTSTTARGATTPSAIEGSSIVPRSNTFRIRSTNTPASNIDQGMDSGESRRSGVSTGSARTDLVVTTGTSPAQLSRTHLSRASSSPTLESHVHVGGQTSSSVINSAPKSRSGLGSAALLALACFL